MPGKKICHLVDHDERSNDEIALLQQQDVRVLGRRNLECYLLADGVLERLCDAAGHSGRVAGLIKCRDATVQEAVNRHGGRPMISKQLVGPPRSSRRNSSAYGRPGATSTLSHAVMSHRS